MCCKPRHKWLLLTELAAALWQDATQVWGIDHLNDWFQNWLHKNPSIQRQYHRQSNQILETDLRNSTLLVRFGEADFGFAHSSMQEYFLSRWIVQHWQNGAIELEQPISELTQQFLRDSLPLLTAKELLGMHLGLAATLAKPFTKTSRLALRLIGYMPSHGLTPPQLAIIDLQSADIRDEAFAFLNAEQIVLNNANANGCSWLDCHFKVLIAETCYMEDSVWRRCDWQTALWPVIDNSTMAPTLADCNGPQDTFPPHWHCYPRGFDPFPTMTKAYLSVQQLALAHSNIVYQTVFSPDGQSLLSASDDGTVKLWDLLGQCLLTLTGHQRGVTSAVFSPDGQTLLSASGDGTVKLWDLRGQCLLTLTGHQRGVTSAVFSPDGQTLLSASEDNTVKLWDLRGQCLLTLTGHQRGVTSAVFSPDGQTLLSASEDNTVKLWDIRGQCLLTLTGHQSWVRSAVFSPDGQTLLSASEDNTVKLWGLRGQCLNTLTGHEGWVTSAVFSPDGQTLLSASGDGTVKLWDLRGQCLNTLTGHEEGLTSAAFSPDCRFIIASSVDGTFRLHDSQTLATQLIYAGFREQWWSALLQDGKIERITGTELAWKMANFVVDGQAYGLDEAACFNYCPSY